MDISENNLVELVRDVRSSAIEIQGEFDIYALDAGSTEFDRYMEQHADFDYILNLSALKHVRSEKDPYTLLRMIDVNIINSIKLLKYAKELRSKKFFCVSTDKAANPANMMGASKRIMELMLSAYSEEVNVSMARFANVAFSDGSLLHGFKKRIDKQQPLSAPYDVRRYFLTEQEAGQLCLLSCLFGGDGEIFFPNDEHEIVLTHFDEIARRFLQAQGLEAVNFDSEAEARAAIETLNLKIHWPCYFFKSDTTGEKDFEDFFTDNETVYLDRFAKIGVVDFGQKADIRDCERFLEFLINFRQSKVLTKASLVLAFKKMIPNFTHEEKGKNLNQKM